MKSTALNLSELNLKLAQNRLIRQQELLAITSKSKSALYREINDGSFPAPVKIGKRAVAWKASDVVIWMEGLKKSVIVEN